MTTIPIRSRHLPGRLAALALLALGACGTPDASRQAGELPGDDPATREPAQPEPEPAASDWAVTLHGAGPIRFGMTVAEASGAMGATIGAAPQGCDYASIAGAPVGMRFMVVDGRIVRAEVDSVGLPSDRGAGVGMTEAEVQARYGDSLQVMPHKYDTTGHYLVQVPSAPDTAYRVLFETDGDRVVRYRAGQLPEVQWVEGCS